MDVKGFSEEQVGSDIFPVFTYTDFAFTCLAAPLSQVITDSPATFDTHAGWSRPPVVACALRRQQLRSTTIAFTGSYRRCAYRLRDSRTAR